MDVKFTPITAIALGNGEGFTDPNRLNAVVDGKWVGYLVPQSGAVVVCGRVSPAVRSALADAAASYAGSDEPAEVAELPPMEDQSENA